MPDWDDDEDGDGELPSFTTEEGQEQWVDILLANDEWVSAQVAHDGKNMVARYRWDDGSEEIHFLQIIRSVEIVRKASPGEEN